MKTLVSVFCLLGVLAPALATTSTQDTSTSFFCGIVLGVDGSKRLLSVEEASLDAVQMTFTVAPDAEIRERNTDITLGDIRVGEPVSVEYTTTATGPVAHAVKVIRKPESE